MVLPQLAAVGVVEALSITQLMQLVETFQLRLAVLVDPVNAVAVVMGVLMQLVRVAAMVAALFLAQLLLLVVVVVDLVMVWPV